MHKMLVSVCSFVQYQYQNHKKFCDGSIVVEHLIGAPEIKGSNPVAGENGEGKKFCEFPTSTIKSKEIQGLYSKHFIFFVTYE